MGILSAKAILEAADTPSEEFEVEEWGGSVLLKVLSCEEREQVAKRAKSGEGGLDVYLLIKACLAEDGSPAFTAANAAALAKKNGKVVQRVVEKVLEINGLTPEAAKANMGKPAA